MGADELKLLENRIDQLINVCRQLQQENQALKSKQNELSAEHSQLVEKTRIARGRIESMIGRLKTLERGA